MRAPNQGGPQAERSRSGTGCYHAFEYCDPGITDGSEPNLSGLCPRPEQYCDASVHTLSDLLSSLPFLVKGFELVHTGSALRRETVTYQMDYSILVYSKCVPRRAMATVSSAYLVLPSSVLQFYPWSLLSCLRS